jgi:hypothetical protein
MHVCTFRDVCSSNKCIYKIYETYIHTIAFMHSRRQAQISLHVRLCMRVQATATCSTYTRPPHTCPQCTSKQKKSTCPCKSAHRHTCMPEAIRPKIVCLPSNQGVGAKVMKNCDPFVSGPEFAMDTMPAYAKR